MCLYGDGIYFARNADFSHTYATPDDKGVHTMLLCRIVNGQMCLGVKGMKTVQPEYDSAVDTFPDPEIFVIFNKDQILPEWIIEYTVA